MMSKPLQIAENLWEFSSLEFSAEPFLKTFRTFLKRTENDRRGFVQRHFGNRYDGYSFPGQSDSYNQGPEDPLHSYVLTSLKSDIKHPEEFVGLKERLNDLDLYCQKIDGYLIQELNLPLTVNDFEPMLSCNFYPARSSGYEGLEVHPDISLFTHFPFGNDGTTFYVDENGKHVPFPKTRNHLVFTGYFAEWFSAGRRDALQHGVGRIDSDIERFAFALFRIPNPSRVFTSNNELVSGEQYHDKYLELFEYPE